MFPLIWSGRLPVRLPVFIVGMLWGGIYELGSKVEGTWGELKGLTRGMLDCSFEHEEDTKMGGESIRDGQLLMAMEFI